MEHNSTQIDCRDLLVCIVNLDRGAPPSEPGTVPRVDSFAVNRLIALYKNGTKKRKAGERVGHLLIHRPKPLGGQSQKRSGAKQKYRGDERWTDKMLVRRLR